MSSGKLWRIFVPVFALAMFAVCVVPASAQKSDTKEKPAMYTYEANWTLPRAQWADMAKSNADDAKLLDKALSNGTIVGYGSDENLVHSADGSTHDDWWSATSMAGVLNMLAQFYQSGTVTSPVLSSATKHWDGIYVSHHYNWHSGSYKGAYTRVEAYKLKADAPDDAVEVLSKNLIAPLLEKLLADGTILEYEIDTEAVHTEDPGTFWIVFITPNAEGQDKVLAAIRDSMKSSPLSGPAFDSMVGYSGHRDYLDLSDGTYK
jgi:hypothetical protein